MIPEHLKTITLRTMVVAVVLMASAVRVGAKVFMLIDEVTLCYNILSRKVTTGTD